MGDKGKRLTSPSDSKHRDPAASIHSKSLPLVDFPLAFTAPATWKHLILITAKRFGSNVVFYVGLRFSPVETACTSTWLEVLQYFVTASLILTFATCWRFHQVFRIWPAKVSREKCALSVRENDRIYDSDLELSVLK